MGHYRCIDPIRKLATLERNPNSLAYRYQKLIQGTKGPAADTNFRRKLGTGLENHQQKNQLPSRFRRELAAEVTVSNDNVKKFPTKTKNNKNPERKGRQNCNKIATQIATRKLQHEAGSKREAFMKNTKISSKVSSEISPKLQHLCCRKIQKSGIKTPLCGRSI